MVGMADNISQLPFAAVVFLQENAIKQK